MDRRQRNVDARRNNGTILGKLYEPIPWNAEIKIYFLKLKSSQVLNGGVKQMPAKERKKHDRFNGMTEEEVQKRILPDHLANNLDIIIVSVISVFEVLSYKCMLIVSAVL